MTKRPRRPRSARRLSTLDDFLAEEGKREEFEAVAVKEVLAWQIGEAMKARKLSQSGLAHVEHLNPLAEARRLDLVLVVGNLEAAERLLGRGYDPKMTSHG